MIGRMDGWQPCARQGGFRWDCCAPYEYCPPQNLSWDGSRGCEHWSFCLEAGAAGQVMACPQVTPLVLHDQSRCWSEGYRQRRKRELKAALEAVNCVRSKLPIFCNLNLICQSTSFTLGLRSPGFRVV